MPVVLAKQSLGFCHCGVQIEAGETVSIENNRASHVGCGQKLEQLEPKKEPESGYLFSDAETAIIEHAKDALGVSHVSFDGATVLQIDVPRLSKQLARVFEVMRDGKFRTLAEIASATGCLESSVSARVRDFRKSRLGGHTVNSRPRTTSPLTYEYQLILREKRESDEQRNAA